MSDRYLPIVTPNVVPVVLDKTDPVYINQQRLFQAAEATEQARQEAGATGVLLATASQSPLVSLDGKTYDTPGREYDARLEKTAELYWRYASRGIFTRVLLTSGLHQHDGQWDHLTCREAGRRRLIELGLPPEAIISEEETVALLHRAGLEEPRQAQDEMLLAARLYHEDTRYGYVFAIGGHAQLQRLLEAALENGLLAIGATPEMDQANGLPLPAHMRLHKIGTEVVNVAAMARAAAEGRSADSQVVADGRPDGMQPDAANRPSLVERAGERRNALRLQIDQVDSTQVLPRLVSWLSAPRTITTHAALRAAREQLIDGEAGPDEYRVTTQLLQQLLRIAPQTRDGVSSDNAPTEAEQLTAITELTDALQQRVGLAIKMAPVKSVLATDAGEELEQLGRRQRVIDERSDMAVSLGLDESMRDTVADLYATLIDTTTGIQRAYQQEYTATLSA